MGARVFSREAFAEVKERVGRAGGDVSHAGKQHIKETKKLHPIVDPAGYGLVRKSLPRYTDLSDGRLQLVAGVPMLIETLLDTTGSMRENVQLAFDSLPTLYSLLAEGPHAVLGRYDSQILNAIFGDTQDNFVLARTQAEMCERIAEQLTLMVPEGDGGDGPEDPEYGLFGAAFLTDAAINDYGLKSYHFTVTDAPTHGGIDKSNLVRVFGETVFDTVAANGHSINQHDLPRTKGIVDELKMRAHAFLICVRGDYARYWNEIYGESHVVVVGSTRYLPYVEAAIIGLVEGVLELSTLTTYLETAGCSASVAREIQRAVAGVPIGAQALLPNFGKIPGKGSVFTKKRDLWPVADAAPETDTEGTAWL